MTLTPKVQSFLKRFGKGFIAGGIASAAALLVTGITVTSVDDLQKLGTSLAVAFITGGLLAIEKMLSWNDTPQEKLQNFLNQ